VFCASAGDAATVATIEIADMARGIILAIFMMVLPRFFDDRRLSGRSGGSLREGDGKQQLDQREIKAV
jgi:hypothetical protein